MHTAGSHATNRKTPTFLCTFSFLKISVASKRCWFSKILAQVSRAAPNPSHIALCVLPAVPSQQRQIQNQRHPVAIDEEEEGQEGVDGGFGHNVCVEAVAEVDGVDVVAGAKLASGEQRGVARRSDMRHPAATWY